jgi:hypothetical protein
MIATSSPAASLLPPVLSDSAQRGSARGVRLLLFVSGCSSLGVRLKREQARRPASRPFSALRLGFLDPPGKPGRASPGRSDSRVGAGRRQTGSGQGQIRVKRWCGCKSRAGNVEATPGSSRRAGRGQVSRRGGRGWQGRASVRARAVRLFRLWGWVVSGWLEGRAEGVPCRWPQAEREVARRLRPGLRPPALGLGSPGFPASPGPSRRKPGKTASGAGRRYVEGGPVSTLYPSLVVEALVPDRPRTARCRCTAS